MAYENELRLLLETFIKSRVCATVVTPDHSLCQIAHPDEEPIFVRVPARTEPIRALLGNPEPHTLYKLTDPFELRYRLLLLPSASEESLLCLGPYLHAPLSPQKIAEIGEKNGILPKHQGSLTRYFSNVPVVRENSHLFVLLDAFGERIFGNTSFSVVDVERERRLPASPINESGDESEDVLFRMKLMEKRYDYENELMQAVSLGQMHKADQLLVGLTDLAFEKRVTDPLRNMKNYCIIMNTLSRKAAENGGVHPIYLDRVSSSFATRIEQMTAVNEVSGMMREMFRSYCRLVRKHSMKDYSPVVQKTIILVDSDLSANLSLRSLAQAQKISSGYLSTIFKRETGKTVTEYIRERRIKHAAHLLNTTHLQIQTVALHCGIMDVQYFSKIFKKYMGKPPKEYRESMKQTSVGSR